MRTVCLVPVSCIHCFVFLFHIHACELACRLVRLDFGPHPDRPAEVSLMCEIQGQYSNVVMVDGTDDTVLLAARQVST